MLNAMNEIKNNLENNSNMLVHGAVGSGKLSMILNSVDDLHMDLQVFPSFLYDSSDLESLLASKDFLNYDVIIFDELDRANFETLNSVLDFVNSAKSNYPNLRSIIGVVSTDTVDEDVLKTFENFVQV